MKKIALFLMLLPMLASAHVSGTADQKESIYGEWWLVGWNEGGNWFEVDTKYVSHRHLSIEIPKEGCMMAYSMVNEIFVGLLTLNGNEMIFDGEQRGVMTQVNCDLTENLFFEDHICDIKFYQLDGNLLRLYYTDNDYFVFTSVINDSEGQTQGGETDDSDYIPFVEVGKQWYTANSVLDSDCSVGRYMLRNEEVIKDGKAYFKLYHNVNDNAPHDVGLLREKDRKVYFIDPYMQEECLMFDYSLKEGDTYETYSSNEQKMVTYKVLSVGDYTEGPKYTHYDYNEQTGSVIEHQRYLRKWDVCRADNGNHHKTWIEGVGSLEGPLDNFYDYPPISAMSYLAYVECGNCYLPFSFYDMFGQVYGCNLPIGAENNEEDDEHHKLTYELEGDRLHVYGEVFCNCGPNHYAYFYDKPTDDPSVHMIEFITQDAEPLMWCKGLHTTDFYISGFDSNLNYIVVDNQGVEHPVINKTPQVAYRPFVEEGKVWVVKEVSGWSGEEWKETYYFEGDTIIDGQKAKRMLCDIRYVDSDREYKGEYVGAWYEQDKKVYFSSRFEPQFKLYYDFTLSSGDSISYSNRHKLAVKKLSGGIAGFKGTYYTFELDGMDYYRWFEGVGSEGSPIYRFGVYDQTSELLVCKIGDEIIYYNSEEGDPFDMGARKQRIDFTHIIKIKPKTRMMREAEPSLYGEYSEQQLGINLNPLDDAYEVRITDETGRVVYEKTVNAGNIVGLNIDISAYAEGRYTVTVENDNESFTGQFETQTTGISDAERLNENGEMINDNIYNLQGQRISAPRKGLNIVNGRKVFVK